MPTQGVLFPTENDITAAIEDVARRHFGRRKARSRISGSGSKSGGVCGPGRNGRETAPSESLQRTAMTYYYAGLAWGLRYLEPSR